MSIQHLIKLLVVLMVLSSCKLNSSKEYHPELSSIPYYENEHVVLDSELNLDTIPNIPKTAQILRDYVQDSSKFQEELLPVLIKISDLTLIEEIADDRIIIADQLQHTLLSLDLETLDTLIVARSGDGPGDVKFVEDLNFADGKLFVGMGGMKISEFGSESDFEYEKTINVDKSVASVSLGPEGILTSGSPLFGPNTDKSLFHDLKALTLWSEDGEALRTLGEAYPLKGNFMLAIPLIDESIVRVIPGTNELILANQNMPILYRYDLNGKLQKTYKISDFIIPVFMYDRRNQSMSIPLDDSSQIIDIQFLDENHVLIYTKTFIKGEEGNFNREKSSIPSMKETRHSFYLLNTANDYYSYLGGVTGMSTKFHVTPNHVFRISEGEVFRLLKD